ncbi:unnamed protein product [Mytilus edulis]|uniref:Uncharacterized protein n=1 Tax=Mytilus edulis TaxID=6550 RepID=A0A8S3RQV2_MYTED|nr:unnamed protein product [Mytilus edulis]
MKHQEISCHIVATMSDRAATEVKPNELLSEFRKETLPLTYYNYNTFTEQEKMSLETMCIFFCGLHALVNFADTAKNTLKELELGIFNNEVPCSDKSYKDNDPGTCRLVRTASKAFGEGSGGDEKSGCQGKFKTFAAEFLREHGMKTVPLRSFRGSRFNILFHNASSAFFLYSKMKEFLENYGAENRLLKSILFDLKTTKFIAGLKALGLLSMFVTCPLWSVLENGNVSIIDMNEKYLQLVTFLDDASQNVAAFMSGDLLMFGKNTQLEKGPIYNSLIGRNTFDSTVEMFLQVLLSALCKHSRKLCADHLPEGN